MNVVIEMHDSECLAVERDETGDGFVLLKAIAYRTDGEFDEAPAFVKVARTASAPSFCIRQRVFQPLHADAG